MISPYPARPTVHATAVHSTVLKLKSKLFFRIVRVNGGEWFARARAQVLLFCLALWDLGSSTRVTLFFLLYSHATARVMASHVVQT